jgi:hypothetical protein
MDVRLRVPILRGAVSGPEIQSILLFGVLQLRVYRLERLHLEVIASKVLYLNILHNSISALFILKAKAVRIAAMY